MLNKEQRDEIANQLKIVIGGFGGNNTSFLTILFTIFTTLKLTGYISWSWWWVTAPIWGGIALVAIFLILVAIILFFIYILSSK